MTFGQGKGFNQRQRIMSDLGRLVRGCDVAGFNPRPRTVGDDPITIYKQVLTGFQPTPTHGGRLCLPETLKNKEKIAMMRESVVNEK